MTCAPGGEGDSLVALGPAKPAGLAGALLRARARALAPRRSERRRWHWTLVGGGDEPGQAKSRSARQPQQRPTRA